MRLDYTMNTLPPIGTLVEAPLGPKKIHAMVVEHPHDSPFKKLKEAKVLADVPVFHPKTVEFYTWVARYTMAAPGDPLRVVLPSGKVPPQPVAEQVLALPDGGIEKLTPKQQQVVTAFGGQRVWTDSQTALADKAGVGTAVIRTMVKNGLLEQQTHERQAPQLNIQLPPLNDEQGRAVDDIQQEWAQSSPRPVFLDGVMGAGKTEVYIRLIADILEKDETAQVLVLVPEISLTPQLLERFEQRLGFQPHLWHSAAGQKHRKETWWDVAHGRARLVVGARSALFLPFKNLSAVVVDEEHDGSYKQEDTFRYHGRDMAVALAKIWAAPLVLASATPSLESWQNMASGRYKQVTLSARHGGAQMPKIRLIDIKKSKPDPDSWLSPDLLAELEGRLERGEQSLVFLNRRGVAPMLICGGCGHRVECPQCDATLVVHGYKLECHFCGFTEDRPTQCPKCGEEALRAFGPGTRKIVGRLESYFPQAKIAVADSDAIKSPAQMDELAQKVHAHEVDILVGTQMVAKGHHFPNLTLVGVVDADMGLAHGDLRAAERTFQLLMQVAGRAGREQKPGTVLLQTHEPNHPVFEKLIHMDRDGFYDVELENRKSWQDPPFGRYIALLLTGHEEGVVKQAGLTLAQSFDQQDGFTLLGPAPAPVTRVKNRYRYRLLVKSTAPAHQKVKAWVEKTPIPSRVRVDIDVDPQTFM